MSWFDPWDAIEAVALNDEPLDRVLARASTPARRSSASRATTSLRSSARPMPSAPPTPATR
jgi:hypothetical protein